MKGHTFLVQTPCTKNKSNAVVGVDPGGNGGIIAGSSIQNAKIIPYPRTAEEIKLFYRRLYEVHGVDNLCCALYVERRPVTDKIPGGAKRLYQMGFDDGVWHCISAYFTSIQSLYCQTWRRICFDAYKGVTPKGGMEWKQLEWKWCKLFTGDRLITATKAKSYDNEDYGISAAFCIWLAAAQSEGLLVIKEEIEKIKCSKAEIKSKKKDTGAHSQVSEVSKEPTVERT